MMLTKWVVANFAAPQQLSPPAVVVVFSSSVLTLPLALALSFVVSDEQRTMSTMSLTPPRRVATTSTMTTTTTTMMPVMWAFFAISLALILAPYGDNCHVCGRARDTVAIRERRRTRELSIECCR